MQQHHNPLYFFPPLNIFFDYIFFFSCLIVCACAATAELNTSESCQAAKSKLEQKKIDRVVHLVGKSGKSCKDPKEDSVGQRCIRARTHSSSNTIPRPVFFSFFFSRSIRYHYMTIRVRAGNQVSPRAK